MTVPGEGGVVEATREDAEHRDVEAGEVKYGRGNGIVEGLETLGRESSMVDNDGEEVKSASTDDSLFRF